MKKQICIIIIILITILGSVFTTIKVQGSQNYSKKTVISIEIQDGDTLWSIAKRYYKDNNGDFKKYIKEIKKCNGMTSDSVYKGAYLAIPIYVEDLMS